MIKLILIALYVYVLLAVKLPADFIDACFMIYYCAIIFCVLICIIKTRNNGLLGFLISCILFAAFLLYFPINRMIYTQNSPVFVSSVLDEIVNFTMANNLVIIVCVLSVFCFIITMIIVFYIKNAASLAQNEQKNILDLAALEQNDEQKDEAKFKEAFYDTMKVASEFIKYCAITGMFFVALIFLVATLFDKGDLMAVYIIINSIVIFIIPAFVFAILASICLKSSLKSSLEEYY